VAGGYAVAVGYWPLLRLLLFVVLRVDRTAPTLSWGELGAEMRAAHDRAASRLTEDEREERRFDRVALLGSVAAAVFFAWHGSWLLVWLVAGAWLIGLVYVLVRGTAVYVRRRRRDGDW
jgi:hypothetical protein